MKKIEKVLESCKKKAIDNFYMKSPLIKNNKVKMKLCQLSQGSIDMIDGFYDSFVEQLNKKINLNKCYERSNSRESELIKELERILITAKISGVDKAIDECKEKIRKYRSIK